MYLTLSYFISLLGHRFVDHEIPVTVDKSDVYEAYRSENFLPTWTFNTSLGYRLQFQFEKFSFYWSSNYFSALEIGDGLDVKVSTRLAHFRGQDMQSNVTSVCNAAWMKIYDPYAWPLPKPGPAPRPGLKLCSDCDAGFNLYAFKHPWLLVYLYVSNGMFLWEREEDCWYWINKSKMAL